MPRIDPTSLFGRDIQSTGPRERAKLLALAVSYWRSRGFPFPRVPASDLALEYERLLRVRTSQVIRGRMLLPSTVGLRVANSFHPQLWRVRTRGHLNSPLDHFRNDATLRGLLERAARIWPNRRCWNAQCLRSMLRIHGGGRVANFRPTVSRAIIARYSAEGDRVVDFSAGYGGRLLGALTLPRDLLCIDPATPQIAGLRRMTHALRGRVAARTRLVQGCAEDILPTLRAKSVDLVFSSPPYYNAEQYSTEATQSFRRYGSYPEWRDKFLRRVIAASLRALRPGGRFIVNAADTRRHPVASDLVDMASPWFRKRAVLRLMMHERPAQRSANLERFRFEPVFVFEKS